VAWCFCRRGLAFLRVGWGIHCDKLVRGVKNYLNSLQSADMISPPLLLSIGFSPLSGNPSIYNFRRLHQSYILSKLVGLVQRSSVDRSKTWEIIDATSIAGQAQAAVRRESWTPENIHDWSSTANQGTEKHIENVHTTRTIDSSPHSGSHDEVDGITRVLSQPSRYTARTASRESDILYAEVLRSLM
jgi:hypothetical protein